MDWVRLKHPNLPGRITEVPASAVGQHAMAGWVPAQDEPAPTCPTCGSVWPAFAESPPEQESKTDEAPAEETGASSSTRRRAAGRRKTSEESE